MDIRDQVAATIRELEPKASAGESQAQYHLFVLLTAAAMEKLDHEVFDRAEKLLLQAAAQGHPDAIQDAGSISMRRYAFERRCQRRKDDAS